MGYRESKCPKNSRSGLFVDEGYGNYEGVPVFDNGDAEKVIEGEEFVVGDVGEALVVRRNFLTLLESKSN